MISANDRGPGGNIRWGASLRALAGWLNASVSGGGFIPRGDPRAGGLARV